ncbi:type VI secretion protein VasK, partial [Erwinia sp. B116]
MNLFNKTGRICGLTFFLLLLLAALAGLIWHHGERIWLDTNNEKVLGFLLIGVLALGVRYFPALTGLVKQWRHRETGKQNNALPQDEARPNRKAPDNVTVETLRDAMRNLYGRRWGRKIRILLITGTVAEVEQLTPGLTEQLWQEDRGTLLLWGGDLNTPVDNSWLTALRRLRRRPADGLVWVTSAFDQLSYPHLQPPLPVPSDGTLDALAYAISARSEALGWQLPLYVWSLHPRAGKPEGRVTQAAGCLLPAGCRADGLMQQLQALSPELVAQGIRQVCHSTQHNFLLSLADQLLRTPQSVADPLSVILNPYRPLPLAGVVFSQVSEDAERSVAH